MKNLSKTFIIVLVLLVILSLIYLQYSYSSKTEVIEGLEYVGSIEVFVEEILIFNNDGELIGFSDRKGKSIYLAKGEMYNVEFKNKMWHRSNIILIDFEKVEEENKIR